MPDSVGVPWRHIALLDDCPLPHNPLRADYHLVEHRGVGRASVELGKPASRVAQGAQERRYDIRDVYPCPGGGAVAKLAHRLPVVDIFDEYARDHIGTAAWAIGCKYADEGDIDLVKVCNNPSMFDGKMHNYI